MGDEGLVIGGALQVMIRKKGFADFLANRHPIGLPSWGEVFTSFPEPGPCISLVTEENVVEEGAKLLAAGSVCLPREWNTASGPWELAASSSTLVTKRSTTASTNGYP